MKKFVWMKLQKDFFTNPRIKKVRSLAGGDTYTCIYLELLLFSLDTDGVIFYENIEQNLEAELALKIDEDEINIKAALAIFESLGLIERGENDDLRLVEACSLMGSECDSAARVRAFRAKKKETEALQCNARVTQSNKNVTTDKEKDKEIEKEEETEKEFYAHTREAKKQEAFKIPPFINPEIWKTFETMRKQIRKPMSERAKKLIVSKLQSLGEDKANEILDQSIVNCWQDVYPLKTDRSNDKEDEYADVPMFASDNPILKNNFLSRD
ncbi:phage replisome organizer N-terminal domain-containing protein, partial [uncultured Campylobacter sp.]|uniref:phage replisome organizer N-terminal domain-containing protein n=1 Tax=uncultured Campylobacter sp. TaxID=218934 RepID=UPI00260BA128